MDPGFHGHTMPSVVGMVSRGMPLCAWPGIMGHVLPWIALQKAVQHNSGGHVLSADGA